MRYFSHILFIVGILFSIVPSTAFATHIVGGDMTYKFIERQGENNRYLFKLNIYYDCFPLDGQAANDSDSTITIAIYQRLTVSPELWRLVGNNGASRMLTVRRSPLVKIENPTFECLVPPATICVYQGVFEFELILKRIDAPYMITYQRCCRNNTINNLMQGGSTGSNFFVELTPEAQQLNNSSPAFKNYPPTIICIGESLKYEHEATDPDGDRLVYKFSPALSSPGPLSRFGCYPSPTSANNNCPPPWYYATYFPQYPYDKPMSGNPLVAIDSVTGRIAGTPNSFGGYVVSVTVEEYRGNVLVGRVFRDFQFNVVLCPKKAEVRLLDADSTNNIGDKKIFFSKCDSTTVTILNNSRFTQFINSYYWEFNIAGQTKRFTDWSPRISFPDTGYYKGILWLNKGERCYDSAYVEVLVGSGLKTNFSIQYDSCNASPVVFTNKTPASYLPIKNMKWDLGDTIIYVYDGTPSVSYQYRTTGLKTAKLTLTNKYGCVDDSVRTFYYQPVGAALQLAASNTEGCEPAKIDFKNLTNPFDSTYKVKWTFGDGHTSTAINPSNTYLKKGNYPVKLMITSLSGCQKETSLAGGITIHPKPKADFDFTPKSINTAQGNVLFEDKSSSDVATWYWQFGSKNSASGQNPRFNFRDTGNTNIQLIVRNGFGCADTISKNLFVEPFTSFFLPNAFSPNNDGVNDDYLGRGYYDSFKNFSLQVFNRWGESVFKTTSPTEGWNGLKNNTGSPLPEGVYLSVLTYKKHTGEDVIVKNYVHLTR